jgi:hypothetical protein
MMAGRNRIFALRQQGSSSFLKKRTKKLLSVTGTADPSRLDNEQRAKDKSFLVLFFKKERLSSRLALHTLAACGRPAQLLLLAGVLLLCARAGRADDLGTVDDFDVRLDTSVRTDFGFRLDAASLQVISNSNEDDGDRSFAAGLISARTDLATELTAQRGELGVDISAEGWYDPVYFQPTANTSPATFNAISAPNNAFPAATRRLMGLDGELDNAFVQDRFTLFGLPVSVRVGRQTLLWGESLYFADNGIAAGQAPVDVIKSLGAPLAQARELYLPVSQVSARVEVSAGVSFEAYDQLQWRRDRLPGVDSFFSTTDILDAGGERVLLPQDFRLYRTADQTPHGFGQFGFALRSQSDRVDLGLYALQYDAKLPVPVYDVPAYSYHLVFPRDIRMVGASFSTYAGSSNIAGEVSFRHNMPLLGGGPTFGGAAATGGGGVYAGVEQLVTPYPAPAVPPAPKNAGTYATGDTWRAQTSLVSQLAPSRWWQAASLQGEIAANDLIGVVSGHDAVLARRTHFAAAIRAVFTPQYFQVLRGLDVSVPIGVGYTPLGRSSTDAGMDQGGGDFTISVAATYRQVWQTAIAFTHFIGGATAQPLTDRDFVSVSIGRTF